MKKRYRLWPLLGLVLLAGCGSPLSRDALREADRDAEYARVVADSQAHRGTTLVLGGRIADNLAGREGTELEVLKYRLGRRDRPEEPAPEEGRFIARTERLLDPSLYGPGRLVSMTATLVGRETRDLRGKPYDYPVFEIGDIHLWEAPPPPQTYPRPFFYPSLHFRYFRGW